MSNKKFFSIWIAITILVTAGFYFGYREYDYKSCFNTADLSECPTTSNMLRYFYNSWQNEKWDDMAKIPFGNFGPDAYGEILSDQKLSKYKIIDYIILDEDHIQFQAMLTINGIDSLLQPKFGWDYRYEHWALIEHDWELSAFDYEAFRAYLYKSNSFNYMKYTMAVFVAAFGMGCIVFLVANETIRKSRNLAE